MNKMIKEALRIARCELRPAVIRTSYSVARDGHNGGTSFARIAGEPLKDTGKHDELALVGHSGRLVCFLERGSDNAWNARNVRQAPAWIETVPDKIGDEYMLGMSIVYSNMSLALVIRRVCL